MTRMLKLAAVAVSAISLCALPVAAAHGARGKPWLPPIKRAGAVLWAAGDGADGGAAGRAVASMIAARRADRFIYLGDVYDSGAAHEFASNYAPLFGRLAPITAPTIGNHEWGNRAQGYIPYWTAARGRAPRDWYAIRAAGWQLIGLSTPAPHGSDSPQVRWLKAKLRRTRRLGSCRIAFMHHPRYSSGLHGDDPAVAPLLKSLRRRAEVVLAGHDHSYQRFHPVHGLTQVVVGTAGHRHYAVPPDRRLAFAEDGEFGALRIILRRRKATLEFVNTAGAVLDRSSVRCRR